MATAGVKEDRITPGIAAKILDVGPGYVRYLVDTGKLPATRGAMGIRLIDRKAVEQLARERHSERAGAR